MSSLTRFVKNFKLPFLVFVLFSLIPIKLTTACGPGNPGFQGYSFLHPDIINKAATYGPYFLRFDDFYNSIEEGRKIQLNDNLTEWRGRFCNLVSIQDLYQVIYKSSVSELKSVQTSIRSKNIPLPPRLSTNSFVQHLAKHKCQETIKYLIFAKKCEPHVVASHDGGWNEAPKRNIEQMHRLVDLGLKEFKKIKSHYIKLRYAYQIIRLAHYMKDYEMTLKLHDFLIPKIDKLDSILPFWIMGHRAGALIKTEQKIEAAYLYSLIFQQCPSKRQSAFQSFHIETDEEWKQCLLLCKNDKERATLFALRANAEHSKAAEEMENIYQLDPKNENLELLLVKEMKNLEKDFLGLEFNDKRKENRRQYNIPRKNAATYLLDLHAFVIKCVKENKTLRPQVWKVADAYLELLEGDNYAANKLFTKLEKEVDEGPLKDQISAMHLALEIQSFENADEKTEDEIIEIIRSNEDYKRYPDFKDFMNDKLNQLYILNNQPGKAFGSRYHLADLKPNPQMDIIENLIEICKKENPSILERSMITNRDGTNILSELMDMKANIFFLQDKPEAALEVLKRIPRNEWDKYQLNPFLGTISDCVECTFPDSMEVFNKVEIIEKIFELEYKARSDFERGAEYYYQLGTAYYNMTYFSYAWSAWDLFRSGSNWYYKKDNIYALYGSPFGNRENMDCTKALHFFERARVESKDLELAAKAAFMAAKCEQKMYFVSRECTYTRSNKIPVFPEEYNIYFNLLKNEYAHTEFYKEVIQECKFLAAFDRR